MSAHARGRRIGDWQAAGAIAAVGLSALSLVGCASHATTSPPAPPAASRPSSPAPVASAAVAPAASPTPCPSESGWTGQNLSMAAPDPAAWLTAAEMPDAAVYNWTAQGAPLVEPFAGDMWNILYGINMEDFLAWQVQSFQGNGESASQTIFLYASAAEAHCAYQSAIAEAAGTQALNRSIQAQSGIPADAVTIEIVSGENDSAWVASWTGPPTGDIFRGPQTDVDYIAQAGTAVTFVGFDLPGLDQSIPDTATAQAVLSEITQHLSVYATGS
jgi:hypothetical protein